jgi:hypothetical protein
MAAMRKESNQEIYKMYLLGFQVGRSFSESEGNPEFSNAQT